MEYTIKNITDKKRTISEEENDIIKRALIGYQIVLGQYEKYYDEQKRKDLEKLNRQNTNTLSSLNPFDVDLTEGKTYEPTKEDTKTFLYTSWAEAIANVKTPLVCKGNVKRGIRKRTFREVQEGKYINKKVRDIMDSFVVRLYGKLILK